MNSVISLLIIGLIISQLILYYLIILLNNKVAKFKDLEIRQNQLMQEMDDTLSVYLIEMREENDRLLRELTATKVPITASQKVEQEEAPPVFDEKPASMTVPPLKEPMEKKVYISKNTVANVYKQQRRQEYEKPEFQASNTLTPEEKILSMYKSGYSIEEIAKQTQKGKTEVELFLKFQT